MRTIKGYRVLDIPLGIGATLHHLYIKEHNDPAAKGKTLFVGNVDYGRTMTMEDIDGYLRQLFQSFGDIEAISVSKFKAKHVGFENQQEQSNLNKQAQETNEYDDEKPDETLSRFAHIIFVKKSSLKGALAASDGEFYEVGRDVARRWGIAHLCKKLTGRDLVADFVYSKIDRDGLREEVEEYMKDFDENQQQLLAEKDRKSREPDADGFVTVKLRSKRKRVEEKRGHGAPRDRKKKKEKELKNFYRFQIREQRQTKLQELRKKFEHDKEKVAAMKAERKFKPF